MESRGERKLRLEQRARRRLLRALVARAAMQRNGAGELWAQWATVRCACWIQGQHAANGLARGTRVRSAWRQRCSTAQLWGWMLRKAWCPVRRGQAGGGLRLPLA